MAIQVGTYRLGPDHATLTVRTKRGGAAAKAGHNLVLHVTSWEATLVVAADAAESSLALDVDATSLRVHEGTGGMQALGDDDKANIEQTIDDEVLLRQSITFRSTRVEPTADGGGLGVQGELTLLGATRPLAFEIGAGKDGRMSATAVIKQSDWGMNPYSALFGTLKVVDEVEVAIDAALPAAGSSAAHAVVAPAPAAAGGSPMRDGFPVLWAPVAVFVGVEVAVALAWIAG